MFQVSWAVSDDFIVSPDPTVLVSRIFDYLLAAHRDAIKAGVKADGSGKQPAFDGSRNGGAFRRAKKGTRPDTRGKISGTFADNLERGPITVKQITSSFARGKRAERRGTKRSSRQKRSLVTEAKATMFVVNVDERALLFDEIQTNNKGQYVAFLNEEEKRGVTYNYLEGAISNGMDDILFDFLKLVMEDGTWKKLDTARKERSKDASL